MSLSNLFSKLKGGAGSGNIGHAGIPGHRGGSAPSKSAAGLLGTKILITGGTSTQRAEVEGVLRLIPVEHISNRKGSIKISIKDKIGLDVPGGRTVCGTGDYLKGKIILAGSHPSLGLTAVHEMAHMLFTDGYDTSRIKGNLIDVSEGLRNRYSPSRGVTAYAKSKSVEYQAESYAYFIVKPDMLKRLDPETYDYLKEVMG